MTTFTKGFNGAVLAGLVTAALAVPHALAEDRGGRGGPGHGGHGERGDRVAKKFERLDTDASGAVSLAEMLSPINERAEKKLARKDQDDDGLLTAAEMQANRHGNTMDLSAIAAEIVQCVSDIKETSGNADIIVPTIASFVSAEDRFAALDTSADGFVDLTELQAGMTAKASSGFTNMDGDADGGITMEEFTAAYQSRRATKKAVRQCVNELTDDGEV